MRLSLDVHLLFCSFISAIYLSFFEFDSDTLTEFGFSCCFKGSVNVPIMLDTGRGSFSKWSIPHKQNPNFETSTPWCRLLSQSAQVNSSLSLFAWS